MRQECAATKRIFPNPDHVLIQMADLFQRDKPVISRHIRNVFVEG